MDYKIFAKENYNLTRLNSTEIIDPLAGLKEFLIDKSADQFKQDLRDLLFDVFEKHGWRRFGAPANLYSKAKNVAKLMDFVWLITTCEVGTQNEDINVDGYYLAEQYRKRTFTKLFHETPAKDKGSLVLESSLARAIFDRRFGLLLKDNIEVDWLKVAFNSSYMDNLTTDFHCIESSLEVKEYWYVMTIIDTAFALANQPVPQLDREALNYYQLFAINVDHPGQLFEEQIEQLYGKFDGVFWYIDEVRFPKAVRTWFSLISKTDHWKDHNDPGNLLFIRVSIQRMVETAWLWSRAGFPKLGNRDVKPAYVNELAALEIADPIAYVGYFFDYHRLHEWMHLLETWLVQSLSDENHADTDVTEKDCQAIIKLIQVLQLILYRAG